MAFSIILIASGAARRRGGHRRSDAVLAWCSDGHLPGDPHPAGFRADAFRADGYSGALSPADGYRAVVSQVVVFQAALFPVDVGQVDACRADDCPEAEHPVAGY